MARTLSANTTAILERLCMAATGPSDNNWRDVFLSEVARTDIPDAVFEYALSRLQSAGLFIPADGDRCRVRDLSRSVAA